MCRARPGPRSRLVSEELGRVTPPLVLASLCSTFPKKKIRTEESEPLRCTGLTRGIALLGCRETHSEGQEAACYPRRGGEGCPRAPSRQQQVRHPHLISWPPHLGRVLANLGSISSVSRPAAKGQDTKTPSTGVLAVASSGWQAIDSVSHGHRDERARAFILGKHCMFSEVGAGIWR